MAALRRIRLRTGAFCNPGATAAALGLSARDTRSHFEDGGHVCWDDHDLIGGRAPPHARCCACGVGACRKVLQAAPKGRRLGRKSPRDLGVRPPYKADAGHLSATSLCSARQIEAQKSHTCRKARLPTSMGGIPTRRYPKPQSMLSCRRAAHGRGARLLRLYVQPGRCRRRHLPGALPSFPTLIVIDPRCGCPVCFLPHKLAVTRIPTPP